MCDWAVKSTNNLNDSEDVNIETFVGAIPMCHPVTCGFPASLWIDEKLSGRFLNRPETDHERSKQRWVALEPRSDSISMKTLFSIWLFNTSLSNDGLFCSFSFDYTKVGFLLISEILNNFSIMIILTNITIVGVILTSEMRRSPNGYFKFHLGKSYIIFLNWSNFTFLAITDLLVGIIIVPITALQLVRRAYRSPISQNDFEELQINMTVRFFNLHVYL